MHNFWIDWLLSRYWLLPSARTSICTGIFSLPIDIWTKNLDLKSWFPLKFGIWWNFRRDTSGLLWSSSSWLSSKIPRVSSFSFLGSPTQRLWVCTPSLHYKFHPKKEMKKSFIGTWIKEKVKVDPATYATSTWSRAINKIHYYSGVPLWRSFWCSFIGWDLNRHCVTRLLDTLAFSIEIRDLNFELNRWKRVMIERESDETPW